MATLNQIIRERKSVLRNLGRALKVIDTNLELQERLLQRVLQRRLKVPEVSDLAQLAKYSQAMAKGHREYLALLNRGYPV